MRFYSVTRSSLLLFAVLAATGCVTTGNAPDERAQVMAVVQQWKQDLLANDIPKILSHYSENFRSEFGNKAEIETILSELGERMVGEDGRIDIENADLVVNGDRASVKPVSIGTRKGAVCRSLYLAKEDGRWLIVEMGRK